jgi:hypothetical protein
VGDIRKMGANSSKKNNRQSSYYASSVAIGEPINERGKSERQENEENRAKRVAMLCRWITDCDIESEMEDFMRQLRELCGEMTAKLFAQTELQTALIAEAEKVLYATAKAMNQFPENDSIILDSLEILDFMEVTDWQGKRGASRQAELVMTVMESTLEKNQENDHDFNKDDVEKLSLCVEIISGMAECHREELAKTECSKILLKTLKSLPPSARVELRAIGFLLAEKLTVKEQLDGVVSELLDTMVKDGLTICDLAKKRWSDVGDDYVSPLLTAFLARPGAEVDASCSATGKTALIAASETAQIGTIKYLLDRGANIDKADKAGRTAIMAAIGKRHLSVVNLLLERGAKVDTVDSDMCNPLHFAVKKNEPEIVAAILSKCDQNKIDVLNAANALGLAPLHVAVWGKTRDESNSSKVLDLLINAGCDVHKQTPNGASALILAVHCRRSIEIIEKLVRSGCDKAWKCQGMLAYDVAVEEGASVEELEMLKV